MQVPMRCPVNPEEWTIVELQGSLSSTTHHSFQGLNLGSLTIRKHDSMPLLRIGNHLLEGKLMTLKEPFLLCKKSEPDAPSEVRIVGVIKKKYLFKNRPIPLPSRPAEANDASTGAQRLS